MEISRNESSFGKYLFGEDVKKYLPSLCVGSLHAARHGEALMEQGMTLNAIPATLLVPEFIPETCPRSVFLNFPTRD